MEKQRSIALVWFPHDLETIQMAFTNRPHLHPIDRLPNATASTMNTTLAHENANVQTHLCAFRWHRWKPTAPTMSHHQSNMCNTTNSTTATKKMPPTLQPIRTSTITPMTECCQQRRVVSLTTQPNVNDHRHRNYHQSFSRSSEQLSPHHESHQQQRRHCPTSSPPLLADWMSTASLPSKTVPCSHQLDSHSNASQWQQSRMAFCGSSSGSGEDRALAHSLSALVVLAFNMRLWLSVLMLLNVLPLILAGRCKANTSNIQCIILIGSSGIYKLQYYLSSFPS